VHAQKQCRTSSCFAGVTVTHMVCATGGKATSIFLNVKSTGSLRVVVHALDPFELESNIAAMHREADILGTYVKHSLNAPRV